MKKLYLVRHGETLFNTKFIVQGQCDSPLTDKGHKQARNAKQVFKENNITFDHAYCSYMHRTEETIQEITSMPYQRSTGLNERSYGTMEGESRSIADHLTYEERSKFYELCGGEKAEDMVNRITTFLTETMNKDDHQSVLCISHGAAMSYFLYHVAPDNNITRLENCHILEFDYDGKFHFIKDYISKDD